MGVVVDTSALIALERRGRSHPPSEDEWRDLLAEDAAEAVVFPAIVIAEALVGVHLADTVARATTRRARITNLATRFPVVPFDGPIAEVWSQLFATLAKAGQTIPANDLAVAATAVYLRFAVLAGPDDEKHFRRVAGLDVKVLK